jgi:riboflavin kinase
VTRPGYCKQFAEKLGFEPFPGTLNLRLKREFEEEGRLLQTLPHIQIEGFQDGERTFGPVKCHRARINDTEEGALISAVRTHYDANVIELIAPDDLRNKLGLRDGNVIRVRVNVPVPEPSA